MSFFRSEKKQVFLLYCNKAHYSPYIAFVLYLKQINLESYKYTKSDQKVPELHDFRW